MPTTVGILTFMSKKNSIIGLSFVGILTFMSRKNSITGCWHFNIMSMKKKHYRLICARKKFYNLEACLSKYLELLRYEQDKVSCVNCLLYTAHCPCVLPDVYMSVKISIYFALFTKFCGTVYCESPTAIFKLRMHKCILV